MSEMLRGLFKAPARTRSQTCRIDHVLAISLAFSMTMAPSSPLDAFPALVAAVSALLDAGSLQQ
jgi:hypothetical protein